MLEQSGPVVAKAFHDLLFANQPPEEGPFRARSELARWRSRPAPTTRELQAAGTASGAASASAVDATPR